MANLRFKRVMRYDPSFKCFRVCRVMWTRGTVGDGKGYSAKLSLAFRPRLLVWSSTSYPEWAATFLGIRVHFQKSFGGIHT